MVKVTQPRSTVEQTQRHNEETRQIEADSNTTGYKQAREHNIAAYLK